MSVVIGVQKLGVPLEVCEQIIEFTDVPLLGDYGWEFKDNRRKTLYSCALVCRDWVPKSRIHLFRSVRLFDKYSATRFISTILTNPGFGQYVRRLEIRGLLPGDWIYKVHWHLSSLLSRLIHLTYSNLPVLNPVFFVLSPRFNVITSLKLDLMVNQSFREVMRVLSKFTNLQKLEINACQYGPFFCRETMNGHGLLSVRIIDSPGYGDYILVDDAIDWLAKQHPANSLKEFEFKWDNNYSSLHKLHSLMSMHTESMIRLKLWVPNNYWMNQEEILARLCSTLAVCANLEDFGLVLQSSSFAHVKSLLSSLPKSVRRVALEHPQFDALPIMHRFWAKESLSGPEQERGRQFWKEVDSTFTRSAYPRLRYFEISIKTGLEYDHSGFKRELVKRDQDGMFKQLVPNLYQRGVLWCCDDEDIAYPLLPFKDPLDWKRHERLFPSPWQFWSD